MHTGLKVPKTHTKGKSQLLGQTDTICLRNQCPSLSVLHDMKGACSTYQVMYMLLVPLFAFFLHGLYKLQLVLLIYVNPWS
jgi:hypothetical protein